MRYQVPQFTDVEDKIIGPLSFRQFIYLAGAAGIIVVLFSFLPKFIAGVIAVPVAVFGAALAFYKINNQPFIKVVEAYLKYVLTKKLYLWKHEEKPFTERAQKPVDRALVPKLSESKLRDLMWSLDIKQSSNPVTNSDENITNT